MPPSIRLFLVTVAIVDDMGAVAIIALVYTAGLDLAALADALDSGGKPAFLPFPERPMTYDATDDQENDDAERPGSDLKNRALDFVVWILQGTGVFCCDAVESTGRFYASVRSTSSR